jgi:hypothetical protein
MTEDDKFVPKLPTTPFVLLPGAKGGTASEIKDET